MRVALISHNAQAGDATGNLVAAKARLLADEGADVRVFVESARRPHPDLAGRLWPVGSARPAGPAWDHVRSADLVAFEFGQDYPLLDWLPWLVGHGPRLLVDYHGITPPAWQEAGRRGDAEQALARRHLIGHADAALVQSRFMADELTAAARLPRSRVHVLHPPVDPARFAPGPGDRLRRRLGLGDAKVALFVGRVAPNKRLPVLIEALALLRERTPAVHAVCVGDDGDVYGLERGRCLRLARSLGVGTRLHFAGHVGADDLVDAYRSADVFVMPSEHEGHCIPVREALASGLPVVAARATALPETLDGHGRLFEPGDAAGLARALSAALAGGRPLAARLAASFTPDDWERGLRGVLLRTLLHPGRSRATEEGIPHEVSGHRSGRVHRLALERGAAAAGT